MFRDNQLPPLPDTRHIQSPSSITHNMVQFSTLNFSTQMPSPAQVNLRISPSIPSTPVKEVFPNRTSSSIPHPFASSARRCSPIFQQPHFPTRPIDHERRTQPTTSIKPQSSSSPRKLQISQSPQGKTLVPTPS